MSLGWRPGLVTSVLSISQAFSSSLSCLCEPLILSVWAWFKCFFPCSQIDVYLAKSLAEKLYLFQVRVGLYAGKRGKTVLREWGTGQEAWQSSLAQMGKQDNMWECRLAP